MRLKTAFNTIPAVQSTELPLTLKTVKVTQPFLEFTHDDHQNETFLVWGHELLNLFTTWNGEMQEERTKSTQINLYQVMQLCNFQKWAWVIRTPPS